MKEKTSNKTSFDEETSDESSGKTSSEELQDIFDGIAQGSKGDREFKVPSSNEKGESRSPQFRVAPHWPRLVELLVISKRFPYNTPSEFYRHALVTHMQYLDRLEKSLPEKLQGMLCQMLAIDEILKDEEFEHGFSDILLRMGDAVRKRTEVGDNLGARELVRQVYDRVQSIPDEKQKEMYSKRIMSRFSGIISPRTNKPADLIDLGPEEGE